MTGIANWTPEEPFTLSFVPGDTYPAASAAAVQWLGTTPGTVLVVGSAPAEARALQQAGHTVTLLDARTPPALDGVTTQQGDGMALPFPDGSFDAVSSTCVMCHAGLGRYGDPVREDGDAAMMAELARVVRRGGRVALMAGPASTVAATLERTHRVYSPSSFWLLLPPTLHLDTLRYYRPIPAATARWLEVGELSADPHAPDYLWAGLRKP